jgi:hypothetical protein
VLEWLARLARLTACGLLVACAGEPATGESSRSFRAIVELDDWRGVASDRDPFETDPPVATACTGPGFVVEQQWLEIDTGLCSWVTLSAAARFPIEAGQRLRVSVSHFDLDAPSAAEGVARLWLGACEAWSRTVLIPAPAAVYSDVFESPCSIAQGESVYFHLHNHGQNNWQLKEAAVER